MRYPASEKLEIIRLVERSHLPVRRTLDKLGIPPRTFDRWYDRYRAFGEAGLEDRPCGPRRVWNRIPDDIRDQIMDLALDEPELSPRELAVTFTDTKGSFVSAASVYRLLKAHDLITSPAVVVVKAADEFHDKTTAPDQLWQTDFTYLKVIGWGWFYLSTILDDFSRYIIAWKLCTTMRADDVTETLNLALKASGCDQTKVVHKPRLPYSPDFKPHRDGLVKAQSLSPPQRVRTFDQLIEAIGEICDLFTPDECWNFFEAAGYASGRHCQTKSA